MANEYLYILLIIVLTLFIIFYGGHNSQNKIEYDSGYFDNLNTIIFFEDKINKICNNISFGNKNFIDISRYFDTTHILIPNFISCFFVKIKPFEYFNIYNIVDKKNSNTSIMILFNHNKSNNLELLVGNSNDDLYPHNNSTILPNISNNTNAQSSKINDYGFFYDLEKIISITGIYHIYNNSNENIIITCFILKKPFWHV
jgi:hypothetical protein